MISHFNCQVSWPRSCQSRYGPDSDLAPDHSNFQVLVSFNLEDDIMFTPMVVGRLMKEIKEKPDKF